MSSRTRRVEQRALEIICRALRGQPATYGLPHEAQLELAVAIRVTVADEGDGLNMQTYTHAQFTVMLKVGRW